MARVEMEKSEISGHRRRWCRRTDEAPLFDCFSYRVQPLRLADSIQLLLFEILERQTSRCSSQAPHGGGHQNLARFRLRGYPHRDIYSASLDDIAFHAASLDAEEERQA